MLDPVSTPTKADRKRSGSIGPFRDEKRTRTSINESVQEDAKAEKEGGYVIRVRWQEFMAAVGDQGVRSDDATLVDIPFPRATNRGLHNVHDQPIWMHNLINDIMADPTWLGAKDRFDNADREEELYPPLRDILHLISTKTQEHAISQHASQTTNIRWLTTPDIPLILPPQSESPITKPDLIGVFGTSAAQPGKIMDWTLAPESYVGRIEAIDVLVPIEVGFTRQNEPDAPHPHNPEEVIDDRIATAPSSSVGLQAGDINAYGQAETRSFNKSGHVEPGRITEAPKAKGIPKQFQPRIGMYVGEPLDKAVVMMGYLATIREVQPFRTSALGVVIRNTQYTLLYSTPMGTLITYTEDIFANAKEFISTIIHITIADYPQFGFDSLWVNPKRASPADSEARSIADPRRGRNRAISVKSDTFSVDKCLLRRFNIHGRSTTVITVRRIISGGPGLRLIVLKCSYVPSGRAVEADLMKAIRAHGIRIMLVEEQSQDEMEFWAHPILEGAQPLQKRQRRIVAMDIPGRMMGTVVKNKDLVLCFKDALCRM